MLNILLTWLLKIRSFPDRSRSAKGFTLMELIIAASLTLIVVGIAGWALVTITKSNKIAKATGEMQYDYNRAVEFITEELKGSKQIYTSPLTSDNLRVIGNYQFLKVGETIPDWMTPVFAFLPDDEMESPAYVIYYIVDTTKSGAPGKELAGDYVLYRWGPHYDANGKYSTNPSSGKVKSPDTWQGNALVDLVLGTWEEVPEDKKKCRRPTDVNATTNPHQWKRYPAEEDKPGFFICVPTAGTLAGKQAEIHALGQIIPDEGNNAYLSNKKGLVYEVVTEAFLRSAVSAIYMSTNGGSLLVVPSSVLGSSGTSGTPPISLVDSSQPISVQVTNLHGNCTATFDTDQTDKGESVAPNSSSSTIPGINTSMAVTGTGGACAGVNSLNSNVNYRPATTGSLITDIVSSTDDVAKLTAILNGKSVSGGTITVINGKITLPKPNQFLMFFEQYPSNPSGETTGLNDKNFDDMILVLEANKT
jgi:hypothetical protein